VQEGTRSYRSGSSTSSSVLYLECVLPFLPSEGRSNRRWFINLVIPPRIDRILTSQLNVYVNAALHSRGVEFRRGTLSLSRHRNARTCLRIIHSDSGFVQQLSSNLDGIGDTDAQITRKTPILFYRIQFELSATCRGRFDRCDFHTLAPIDSHYVNAVSEPINCTSSVFRGWINWDIR
jgi:hypothetical protein